MILTYGIAKIVSGEHAGRVCYYDDDDIDDVVVYFDSPMKGSPVVLSADALGLATEEEAEAWRERTGFAGEGRAEVNEGE